MSYVVATGEAGARLAVRGNRASGDGQESGAPHECLGTESPLWDHPYCPLPGLRLRQAVQPERQGVRGRENIDEVAAIVHGKGGHGAHPDRTIDPVVIGAAIVVGVVWYVRRHLARRD